MQDSIIPQMPFPLSNLGEAPWYRMNLPAAADKEKAKTSICIGLILLIFRIANQKTQIGKGFLLREFFLSHNFKKKKIPSFFKQKFYPTRPKHRIQKDFEKSNK